MQQSIPIMGSLIIRERRSKLSMSVPHKIFINNICIGIMNSKQIQIKDIPVGCYDFKIQSMIPFISATTKLNIHAGENTLSFHDREKFWDILFIIDLILMVFQWFVAIPEEAKIFYQIFTNGYFAAWILYTFLIRKHYFKFKQGA